MSVIRFDEYTDVLCSETGIDHAEFPVTLSPTVSDVVRVDILAYEIPCDTRTITELNNVLNFEVQHGGVTTSLSATLRPGQYYIGTVVDANGIRQATDGVIKELQDQMNIAWHAHNGATFPASDWADPREPTTVTTPHFFLVTLEDEHWYDPALPVGPTNLPANGNRKTRVHVLVHDAGYTLRLRGSSSVLPCLGFAARDHVGASRVRAGAPHQLHPANRWCVIQLDMGKGFVDVAVVALVPGHTAPLNMDGSMSTYIQEMNRLCVGGTPISGVGCHFASQHTGGGQPMRPFDWGARPWDLCSKTHTNGLSLRIVDMHTGQTLLCQPSDTIGVLIRLFRPRPYR